MSSCTDDRDGPDRADERHVVAGRADRRDGRDGRDERDGRGWLDELRVAADGPGETARMLPLAAYRSDDVLALELAELFGRDWLCVGRTADVPTAGSYVRSEVPFVDGGSRPLLVVRGDDDRVRVFDNVCVHRGALLEDANDGTTNRFTCPYHAWSYRLDGSAVGGPHMGGADVGACSLSELPTEIWEGFVFVNQGPEPVPLAPRLAGLTDVVGRYRMSDYTNVFSDVEVWNTNWKLLVENFVDAYHVFRVHAESFGATGDSTGQTTVYPGGEAWTHHRVVEIDGPELIPADDGRLAGDWRRTIVLAAVFPGFVVQLQPDWMWHLEVVPIGTDRVRIAWEVSIARPVLAALADEGRLDRFVGDLERLIRQVNGEDRPIVEGVRHGVHRPQFDRGPLSPLEGNVVDFDRYVARRLTIG